MPINPLLLLDSKSATLAVCWRILFYKACAAGSQLARNHFHFHESLWVATPPIKHEAISYAPKIKYYAFDQCSKNHLLYFKENEYYFQNYATNFSQIKITNY